LEDSNDQDRCTSLSKLFPVVAVSCSTIQQQAQQEQQQQQAQAQEHQAQSLQLSLSSQEGVGVGRIMEVILEMPGHGHSIQSSLWRHYPELGRGYLLLADIHNRIWRWERGGGPIPIGRSLHLDHVVCRHDSVHCMVSVHDDNIDNNDNNEPQPQHQPQVGGMTMDFFHAAAAASSDQMAFWSGQLVVAEWGEGRIIRLEENGARTPLALLPLKQKKNNNQLLVKPQHLLMTPFRDLLFLEQEHDTFLSLKVAII
jgi:hypothetical protein